MDNPICTLVALATIIITIAIIIHVPKETYTNAPLRARHIVDWFNRTNMHGVSYVAYREHMANLIDVNAMHDDADIVEYQTAKILYGNGRLTVDTLLAKT